MKGELKSTNNSLSNNRLSRQLSAWGNNSDSALFPPSTLKPLYHPAPQSPNPPPLPSPTNVSAIASLSVTAVLDCSYSVSCSNLESKRSAPTAGDFQKQQASSNVNLLSWSVVVYELSTIIRSEPGQDKQWQHRFQSGEILHRQAGIRIT